MFGFKKELYTPEYQLAGDECAIIETSKGTIKVKFALPSMWRTSASFPPWAFMTALSFTAMCPAL